MSFRKDDGKGSSTSLDTTLYFNREENAKAFHYDAPEFTIIEVIQAMFVFTL
jgi:hypothetical protein